MTQRWRSGRLALGRVTLAATAIIAVGSVGIHTAGATVTGPKLERILGRSNQPDEYSDEYRMDFTLRVPHSDAISSVAYDADWNGTIDTTASLATGPGINNEYQIISRTTDGSDDLVTIALRGDANADTNCPSSPITAKVQVTTTSGSVTITDPWVLDNAMEECPGTARPMVRLGWDNNYGPSGVASGNSQSGFSAVTTTGVVNPSTNTFILDATNINSYHGDTVNDCEVTDSVSYQWVKADNSPTALTPSPVARAVTPHNGGAGYAIILPTQDFTADGPGYYKLIAWPNAHNGNNAATPNCSARAFTPGNFAPGEYFQVGSVFYNYAAPATADLQVVKSVDTSAGTNVGSHVTYTVVATNNGPSTAVAAQVVDHLPAGLTFVSATPSTGSFNSSTGVWSIGDLANGATASLQITATITSASGSGTVISNTAVGSSSSIDPDTSNNSGVATFTGTPLVAPLVALALGIPALGIMAVRRRRRLA